MAVPHPKSDMPAWHEPEIIADAPPAWSSSPTHELQRMLERHFGERADLPSPSQSRLLALVEPLIAQFSRLMGLTLFGAAVIGMYALLA